MSCKSQNIDTRCDRTEQDFERAEHLYHEAIKLADVEFDELIPEIALARYLLSTLYLDQTELLAAEAFAMSALEVSMELFGEDHPATGMALHQLGDVHSALNKSEARVSHKQAANILTKNYFNLSKNFFLTHDSYTSQFATAC